MVPRVIVLLPWSGAPPSAGSAPRRRTIQDRSVPRGLVEVHNGCPVVTACAATGSLPHGQDKLLVSRLDLNRVVRAVPADPVDD